MDFLCITFGPAQDVCRNGWWNRKQRFYTAEDAIQCGKDQLSTPNVFGYVVIEDDYDWWKIVDELGAPSHAVSISCNGLGNYQISPASLLTSI